MVFGLKKSRARSDDKSHDEEAAAAPDMPLVVHAQPKGADQNVNPDRTPAMHAANASGALSQALGAIIRVLMQAPHTKHFSLADLERLALPAVKAGQFRLAEIEAADRSITQPAALILWARVSDDVDQRLSQNLTNPIRLQPTEWTSGDIIWLIEAAGNPRFIEDMLRGLCQSIGGHPIKLCKRSADGHVEVGTWTSAGKVEQ